MKSACRTLFAFQTLWYFAGGSEIKGCFAPVAPYLGRYTPRQTTYKPNDSIFYSCNNGSHIFGSATRVCKSNGVWDQNAPYCSQALHGISVDKKWEILLDKNFSSCVRDKSVSLSFNYAGNFSGGVIMIHSLESGNIDAFITLNGQQCNKTSNHNTNFREFKCSSHHAKGNTRQNLTVALFSAVEFCEIEIYPPKDEKCAVLINSSNISLRFEPPAENGYVSYGTAAIHNCNYSYHLVGEHVRYCSDDRHWSGNESYCELARPFTTVARNFTIIVITVSISSAIVLLIGVIGAVYICKKKCKKKKSMQGQFCSGCGNNAKSEDMHCYSTINYDTILECSRKPLPEIPYSEINDYTEPIDAKAESLAGVIYAEPDEFYNKCNTLQIATKTDNLVTEFRNHQKKRRVRSLKVKSLQ